VSLPWKEDLMPEDAAVTPQPTPWHLWLVGILGLLWNAMGAFDYLMTETHNESYMSRFTPEQLEFFYGFPMWVVAFWAVAVWGGLLGAILLLLRKRLAAPVLLVSFLAMIVTAIHNFLIANGLEIMGGMGFLFTVLIFLFALILWLYARAMARGGVLA
jgi:hypothetical protein